MSAAKKQRVRGPTGRDRLPADLIQHIAAFVPDSGDFFNYLAAFRHDPPMLGHLAHFVHVAESTPLQPHELWPCLRLRSAAVATLVDRWNKAAEIVQSFQTILKYHVRVVEVTMAASDPMGCASLLEGILTHVNDVHVRVLESRALSAVNQWPICPRWTPQITKLAIPASVFRDVTIWKPMLGQMRSLSALEVCFDGTDARVALEFVLKTLATSPQITSFRATCPAAQSTKCSITPSMLQDILQWLSQSRVESFAFSHWDFDGVEDALPEFYNAVFTHPNVQEVALAHSRLPRLHRSLQCTEDARPFTVCSISLTDCVLSSLDMQALACGLCHSTTVQSFQVADNPMLELDAVLALARAMPTTHLCHVNLTNVPMSDAALNAFCAGVAATVSLRRLTLCNVACRGDSLRIVATHLPTMPHLRSITYSGDTYGDKGCKQLFAATMMRSPDELRSLRLGSLNLSANNITDVGAAWLASSHLPQTVLTVTGNRISKAGMTMCERSRSPKPRWSHHPPTLPLAERPRRFHCTQRRPNAMC